MIRAVDVIPESVRAVLDVEVWAGTVGAWALALGIFLAVLAAGRLVVRVLHRRLQKAAKLTEQVLDDALVEAIGETRGWFYVALGLRLATGHLALPARLREVVDGLTMLAFLWQIGLWVGHLARSGVDDWVQRAGEDDAARRRTAAGAFKLTLRIVVWSVLLLVFLQNLGVEIGGLLAGLGVGGVAAALAVQNVLGDLFASLSIYFDRPFDVGDFVVVGDYMGEVDRIGWRSSRLRSLGGELLVLANSDLAKSRVRNFRKMFRRRVVTKVGVVYGTPHDTLRDAPGLLRESVEAVEGTTFERAHFQAFGAYSLDFEMVWHVEDRDYGSFMDKQQEVLLGIHRRFEAAGLAFAFPTQTLDFEGPVPVAPPAS
ncbi:MAG: mechanosensitive ion channel domain-containing protein [Myxococcota bacterium]